MKTEAILDAAISLVEHGGLEALTIHKLAAEVDLAVGAIYRYWPSMDSLNADLQRRIIRDYHEALLPELDLENPLRSLMRVAAHYQNYFAVRRGRLGVLALSMSDPRRLLSDEELARVLAEVTSLLERVRALFEAAREDLRAGDPAERTIMFWATLQGVMQLQKLERFPLSAISHESLMQRTVKTLLIGFGASPRKLRNG